MIHVSIHRPRAWLLASLMILSVHSLILEFIQLFYLKSFGTCAYVCEPACVHELHRSLWWAEEGTGSPGAGVTGGCELPRVGAGN